MKTINVHTKFSITRKLGSRTTLEKGEQTVEDDIADHWYTKANSTPVEVATDSEQPENGEQTAKAKTAKAKTAKAKK